MSITRTPWRGALAVVAALAWLTATLPVAAHAELQATSPAAGASLDSPPEVVAARFSEAVVGESSIDLVGPDGQSVATGGIDPADSRRLILTMPPGAGPGEYTVEWQAFAADGHLERGTFTFTVLAPTPAPATPPPASATPAPTPAPTPRPSPTDVPLPSPSAGPGPAPTSGSDVIVPIVAAVVALAVLGVVLLRGRGARRA